VELKNYIPSADLLNTAWSELKRLPKPSKQEKETKLYGTYKDLFCAIIKQLGLSLYVAVDPQKHHLKAVLSQFPDIMIVKSDTEYHKVVVKDILCVGDVKLHLKPEKPQKQFRSLVTSARDGLVTLIHCAEEYWTAGGSKNILYSFLTNWETWVFMKCSRDTNGTTFEASKVMALTSGASNYFKGAPYCFKALCAILCCINTSDYWSLEERLLASMSQNTVFLYPSSGKQEIFSVYSILYIGQNILLSGTLRVNSKHVVLKIHVSQEAEQINNEASILKRLAGSVGVPNLLSEGQCDLKHFGMCPFVITAPVGESLESVFGAVPLARETVYWIASESIKILSTLHKINVIHGDLRPENFIISEQKLFLIDYGLSQVCKCTKRRRSDVKYYCGTLDFVPGKYMAGYTYIPKDDLESLGYVLLFLLEGCLPWWREYESIIHQELHVSLIKLKTMKDNPASIVFDDKLLSFVKYISKLPDDKQPNYQFCIDIF